jgi:hypothetical protein
VNRGSWIVFVDPRFTIHDSRYSALALFVSWIAANYEKLAVPPHELAVLTDAFHARPNLHRQLPTADIMPEMESVNIAIPIRPGKGGNHHERGTIVSSSAVTT